MIPFLKNWMLLSLYLAAGLSAAIGGAVIVMLIFTGLWKLMGIVGVVIGCIFAIGFGGVVISTLICQD